jgi:predicted DNA-binding transcriptional regulator AlpA
MTDEQQHDFITRTQLANYLGISELKLTNALYRNDAPQPIKSGKRLLWTKAIVEAWVAARFETQRAEADAILDAMSRNTFNLFRVIEPNASK